MVLPTWPTTVPTLGQHPCCWHRRRVEGCRPITPLGSLPNSSYGIPDSSTFTCMLSRCFWALPSPGRGHLPHPRGSQPASGPAQGSGRSAPQSLLLGFRQHITACLMLRTQCPSASFRASAPQSLNWPSSAPVLHRLPRPQAGLGACPAPAGLSAAHMCVGIASRSACKTNFTD